MRLLVLAALLASTEAGAAVCLEIDPEHDQLEPADRDAAIAVVEQTARLAGIELDTECTEHWRLTHTRLGTGIHVVLWLGTRGVAAMAPALEALPAAYAEIFDELRPPPPAPARPIEAGVVATVGVPRTEPAPAAIYARIGYATTGQIFGPTLGLGYRRWISKLGFDLSAMSLMIHKWPSPYGGSHADVLFSSIFRLAILRSFERGYVGAGVGYGESIGKLDGEDSASGIDGWHTTTDHGLQFEVLCGIELLRHRAMRVSLELEVKLPTYTIVFDNYFGPSETDPHARRYSPTVGASLAFGF